VRRVPFLFCRIRFSFSVKSWRPKVVIIMSDRETEAGDRCQACHGTGTVAGVRPVRTGPFLLNPPLCRVCGGTGRKPQPRE
jgi:hypothetical protein